DSHRARLRLVPRDVGWHDRSPAPASHPSSGLGPRSKSTAPHRLPPARAAPAPIRRGALPNAAAAQTPLARLASRSPLSRPAPHARRRWWRFVRGGRRHLSSIHAIPLGVVASSVCPSLARAGAL